ncbi:VOC family protein [Pelagibacterium xiamenense]|uniref:VOC family protein n=1 Tax=Pelagibacterium xiamenense TaxID=2901140 RepID=UPI001E2CC320|nr:VOC family protein [Pelagibacterium xiamenense]MCD7060565.1 VOC family protein [Pelagibacterium xiamenense]
MSTTSQNSVATQALVPTSTRLGEVHIAVTGKDDALAVWRDVVGLALLEETPERLVLGAGGTPLIVLHLDAAAPVAPHTTGLYHVAIHVPTRRDFARALNRAIVHKERVSPTDHLVSEALYLWDRDGNGIEITFETPWRGSFVQDEELRAITPDGKPHSGREPIDVPGLLAELEGDPTPLAPMPEGTRIGHVHVHVGDLDAAMVFYRDRLGFAGQLLSRRYGMGDVTLDYAPHILAFNIWAGRNAPPPPQDAAGLRWFEIVVPDEETLEGMRTRLADAGSPVTQIERGIETRDPWENRIKILRA